MAQQPTYEDMSRFLSAASATQKLVDFNLKKLIEDEHVSDMIAAHPEYANLAPMFSPLSGLTYLPEDKETGVNAWYSRIARLRGMILIEECYAAEDDDGALQFLMSLEEFGKDRAYDSRRGFKAITVTENKINLESPGLRQPEKKKFLGIF